METRPHFIHSLIAAGFLLFALYPHDYGYYIFLRWLVTAASVASAYLFAESKYSWASYVFGSIALLFNPIIPIHLTRSIWQPIDVIVAAVFLISIGFPVKKAAESGK